MEETKEEKFPFTREDVMAIAAKLYNANIKFEIPPGATIFREGGEYWHQVIKMRQDEIEKMEERARKRAKAQR